MKKDKRRKKYSAENDSLVDAVSDEEFLGNSDTKSREYIYDEEDEFYEAKDKLLLEKTKKLCRKEESFDDEEVLGLSSSDESDYSDVGGEKLQLAEMDSDIEGNEEPQEEEDIRAWGKEKYKFIGGQDVDQAYTGYTAEDQELAAIMEEEEALAIQKRMTEQMDEDDYGLELFKPASKSKTKEEKGEEEKIKTDLSKLTRTEKLRLLKKESPELLDIVEDFRLKMAEIKGYLQELVTLVHAGKIPPGAGANYIQTKYDLILNYCTNISFYLVLKARRTPIQYHPIIKRLVHYRNLLKQLEPVDEQVAPQIQLILDKLAEGEPISNTNSASDLKTTKKQQNRSTKKLNILRGVKRMAESEKERDEGSKKDNSITVQAEEKKLKKSGVPTNVQIPEEEEDMESMNDEESETDDITDEPDTLKNEGKRAITYQMAKNKGLTPYRKKEQRNPRVKMRRKYRDALKKRSGQVRKPVTELERYGGEKTGIKAWQSKSIKLK